MFTSLHTFMFLNQFTGWLLVGGLGIGTFIFVLFPISQLPMAARESGQDQIHCVHSCSQMVQFFDLNLPRDVHVHILYTCTYYNMYGIPHTCTWIHVI